MASGSSMGSKRSCTDTPCLLVFAAFIIGWIVVASIAMSQGSIRRFTLPSDSSGNICGVNKGYEHKPYLLFFDLTKCAGSTTPIFGCQTPQICVAKCPESYFFGALPTSFNKSSLNFKTENELKAQLRYCLPDVDPTMTYVQLVDGYHCAPWYVRSRPVAGRCVPDSVADSVDKLKDLSADLHHTLAASQDNTTRQNSTAHRLPGGRSLVNSTKLPVNLTLPALPHWNTTNITQPVIQAAAAAVQQMQFVVSHFTSLTVSSLLVPLLLSLLFLVLLRCFVGPIVWLSLVGAVLGLLALSAACGYKYRQVAQRPPQHAAAGSTASRLAQTPLFWMALLILCAALALLVLVLVIALRKRIKLAVAILKQCSTAIADMLSILLMPVISFTLQLVAILAFVFVCLHLFGSSHEWHVEGSCTGCPAYTTGAACFPQDFATHCGKQCPKASCRSNQQLLIYAYNFVALVWAVNFVSAVHQIAVAITFSTWYFSGHKRLQLALPMIAYTQALTFHSGTAAFGSLLITLCRLVRWTLTAARKRLERRGGCAARAALCCCACCCWCLDNCLQFINRRAYIVTALESVGLCPAGRKGVQVVMRNMARVAVADCVTALILMLGRLLVVAGSVLLCHLLLTAWLAGPVPWALLAIFSGLLAFAVSGIAFSLTDMGVDTIFYCAMVDLDLNDGSTARPYMMSAALAAALGVRNAPPPPLPPPATAAAAPPKPSLASQETTASLRSAATPSTFLDPGAVERRTPETPRPQPVTRARR